MKYIKLRVDFEEAEKGRFYRIVLVKHDIILQDLGSLFVLAFGGALVHSFLFRTETASYEPSVWVRATNDNAGNKRKTYAHCDHTIKELPTNFLFWYDTGDDWTFICKKYQKEVERKSKEDIIVLEGAGNGIWEDNKSTLIAYLEGEIKDDNCNEKNEKKGFYKPWNVHIKKFSDFDQPINIKAIHNYIKQNRMSKK